MTGLLGAGPADTVTNAGIITIGSVTPPPPHLLISEVCYNGITEPGDEFIEIWNPNDTPVTLTNYFLSDAPLSYYRVVDNTQGAPAGDFTVRFPAGIENLFTNTGFEPLSNVFLIVGGIIFC